MELPAFLIVCPHNNLVCVNDINKLWIQLLRLVCYRVHRVLIDLVLPLLHLTIPYHIKGKHFYDSTSMQRMHLHQMHLHRITQTLIIQLLGRSTCKTIIFTKSPQSGPRDTPNGSGNSGRGTLQLIYRNFDVDAFNVDAFNV